MPSAGSSVPRLNSIEPCSLSQIPHAASLQSVSLKTAATAAWTWARVPMAKGASSSESSVSDVIARRNLKIETSQLNFAPRRLRPF